MIGHVSLSTHKCQYCQLNIHGICGVQKPKGYSSVAYSQKNFSCCKKRNIAQTEANNSNSSNTPSTTKISYTEDIMRKKNNVELNEICRENNLRIDGKRRI